MLRNIIIRDFRTGDAQALSKLFYQTIRTINIVDYNQKQVQAWAPDDIDQGEWLASFNDKTVFVAEEYETPIGFCELTVNGYIDRFYIAKDRVQSGVGRELFKNIEKKARDLNIKNLFVDASITAKPFFEKMGFLVKQKQTVKRRGVELTNFQMQKSLV